MKHFSEEAFLQDFATINWQDVLGTSDDVNKLVERFSTLFSLMIEKDAPLRQSRVSEKYCPWMNADLKRLIRTRDRLAVKHKSQVMISSYMQCRHQVNTLNVTLKQQYFSDKILQQKGNRTYKQNVRSESGEGVRRKSLRAYKGMGLYKERTYVHIILNPYVTCQAS